MSVLALANSAVGLGATTGSSAFGGIPQLNHRTYVTPADDGDEGRSGVYFFSLDSGRRLAAAAGRRLFGLPFHHATMRLTRRDDRVAFRRRRRGRETPAAVCQARYRPTGDGFRADNGTLDALCVEQFQYYVPASMDHRFDGLQPGEPTRRVRVGTIDRDPWELRPMEATIRENTLFEAAGMPTPTADPVVHYSPGFEMAVEPLRRGSKAE